MMKATNLQCAKVIDIKTREAVQVQQDNKPLVIMLTRMVLFTLLFLLTWWVSPIIAIALWSVTLIVAWGTGIAAALRRDDNHDR